MTDAATTGGIDFLTGQSAAGEILAVKLRREMLSPDEALRYGLDIGGALSRAHTQGWVHGKVSPQTVLISEGRAILLRPLPGASQAAAYRAPEEVMGKTPDARSDIFAFGVLLYEMASGDPPFRGEGLALNAAILEDTPPALQSPLAVHRAMDKVIAGCLEKDPSKRRQRIQNAVTELKLTARTLSRLESGLERRALPAPAAPPAAPTPAVRSNLLLGAPAARPARPVRPNWPSPRPAPARAPYPAPRKLLGMRVWITISAALFLCAASVAAALFFPSRNSAPVYRFSVDQEDVKYPGMPAVSPDGRNLSWSAIGPDGKRVLWVQALDATHAKAIPNTEDASAPFWSSDSAFIGFFADGFLRKARIRDGESAGTPQIICAVDAFSGGGAWNGNDTILFASSLTGGLSRVQANGGSPQVVTRLDAAKGESAHLWPQFMPDGKRFIFFVQTDQGESTGVYGGALDSPTYSRILSTETNAVFAPGPSSLTSRDGFLLFIRSSGLIGQPFSASKMTTTGEALTLATNIEPVESLRLAQISASENGTLVYQSAGKSTRQLFWVDRSGKNQGMMGGAGDWGPPRISPDGKRVVAGKRDEKLGSAVLWLMNIADGSISQLTHLAHGGAASPVWSPDSSRIAFSNSALGIYDLYVQPADGAGKEELLFRTPYMKMFDDWSRDGRTILFDEMTPGMNRGLRMWNAAERKATTLVDTIRAEGYGALSPDGKWLAYQSDETGRNEVIVQAFDGATSGTRKLYTISTGGGGLPRWRRDGGELYYLTQPGKMFAVTVHPSGREFAFDPPHELFHIRPTPRLWNLYDVAPDGQRFLINAPMDWPGGSKIIVTTSWLKELQ